MTNLSTNGNGSKPFHWKNIANLVAGNPLPMIRDVIGKVSQKEKSASPRDATPPADAPKIASHLVQGGGAWLSPSETLRRAEQRGYEFGCAGELTEITEADVKLLAEMAAADVASLPPAYDPEHNAGDREFEEARGQRKAELAACRDRRLPYAKEELRKAQDTLAEAQAGSDQRPAAARGYVAAASLLIGLLPFLTVRDLMLSAASDDQLLSTVVGLGAGLIIGFVSTDGLFQAPPLKEGEGRATAWKLAAGLPLSLFLVRLSFTGSLLASLGFTIFEFCAICMVEHYARRQRHSAYEWDAAHAERRRRLAKAEDAGTRLATVRQERRDLEVEIQRMADELGLRDLQARAPQYWAEKVLAAYRFGLARAVGENVARRRADAARLAAEESMRQTL